MSTTSDDRWPAVESSSELLTDFLHQLLAPNDAATPTTTTAPGPVPTYSLQDVWSLDEDCLGFVPQPVLALIFAYDNDAIATAAATAEGEGEGDGIEKVVFIKQLLPLLDNACGSLAVLHAALNALPSSSIPKSSLLASLRPEGEVGVTGEEMARRLDAHDAIRGYHCQCAQAGQTEQVQGDQVKFHFVCLLPPPEEEGPPSNTTKNHVLELDGLKAGPVLHTLAASDEQDKCSFLHQAVAVLKAQFLAKFAQPEETAMNVLALVQQQGDVEES